MAAPRRRRESSPSEPSDLMWHYETARSPYWIMKDRAGPRRAPADGSTGNVGVGEALLNIEMELGSESVLKILIQSRQRTVTVIAGEEVLAQSAPPTGALR